MDPLFGIIYFIIVIVLTLVIMNYKFKKEIEIEDIWWGVAIGIFFLPILNLLWILILGGTIDPSFGIGFKNNTINCIMFFAWNWIPLGCLYLGWAETH